MCPLSFTFTGRYPDEISGRRVRRQKSVVEDPAAVAWPRWRIFEKAQRGAWPFRNQHERNKARRFEIK